MDAQVLRTGVVLVDLPGQSRQVPLKQPNRSHRANGVVRPGGHKLSESAGYARLLDEMRQHIHSRRHLPRHLEWVFTVISLHRVLAARPSGVGGVSCQELEHCCFVY